MLLLYYIIIYNSTLCKEVEARHEPYKIKKDDE